MSEKLNNEVHVPLHLFEGGIMPQRMSERAIGYDVFTRAIVSAFEQDEENPILRKTIFDFENIPNNASFQEHIEPINNTWAWRLDPGGRVLIGIGFATALPETNDCTEYFYWVSPRSGLASKYGITVGNAPGTIDADYRGEAGVLLINQGDEPFYITKGSRIAQIIFADALIPNFIKVDNHQDLPASQRHIGGFGSTGGYHSNGGP